MAYCKSDVRLLKEGCLTFKRLFEAKAGFNPFEHITIASACNRDLRMNRMIPKSIASEPVNGWRSRINQSRVALEWLTWCEHQRRQQVLEQQLFNHPQPNQCYYVQHAGNSGEYGMPATGFTVDGFEFATNTVYEFHGCFWHGCTQRYPVRHEKHLRLCDRTMLDAYEKTQNKMRHLRILGYNVVEMWECEWARLKQTSPDIQAHGNSLHFVEPLNPRDAFCGGRTNAVKLYHHETPGQKIHYIDYKSLYPWVNKTCVYPKVILGWSHIRVTRRLTSTLVSSNVESCTCVNCTIPHCLTAMPANSPFLSVPPACKKKWPNLPCRDLTSAHTPMTSAP